MDIVTFSDQFEQPHSHERFSPRPYLKDWYTYCQQSSLQQAGFMEGRSIVENILLVQEIVHDIKIKGNPAVIHWT